MEVLHSITIQDQDCASNARIFCLELAVNMEVINKLLKAQEIIEANWLGDFPALIYVSDSNADLKHPEQLYGEVHLVMPEEWQALDPMHTFLVNEKMYNLGESDEPPYFNIDSVTADALLELFKTEMFVVATLVEVEEDEEGEEGYGASSGTGPYGYAPNQIREG